MLAANPQSANPSPPPSAMTIKPLSGSWLELQHPSNVEGVNWNATCASFTGQLNAISDPVAAKKRLRAIGRRDLQVWRSRLQERIAPRSFFARAPPNASRFTLG